MRGGSGRALADPMPSPLSDELSLSQGIRIVARWRPGPGRHLGPSRPVPALARRHLGPAVRGGELDLKKIGAHGSPASSSMANDITLRYKGVLAIAGEPRRPIVQGHRVAGFDYGPLGDETPRSRLVIIGRYLPVEVLRADFLQTQE